VSLFLQAPKPFLKKKVGWFKENRRVAKRLHIPWRPVYRMPKQRRIKVFCFFSSEKKAFLHLLADRAVMKGRVAGRQ
jgi:hypothetical protein